MKTAFQCCCSVIQSFSCQDMIPVFFYPVHSCFGLFGLEKYRRYPLCLPGVNASKAAFSFILVNILLNSSGTG